MPHLPSHVGWEYHNKAKATALKQLLIFQWKCVKSIFFSKSFFSRIFIYWVAAESGYCLIPWIGLRKWSILSCISAAQHCQTADIIAVINVIPVVCRSSSHRPRSQGARGCTNRKRTQSFPRELTVLASDQRDMEDESIGSDRQWSQHTYGVNIIKFYESITAKESPRKFLGGSRYL